MSETALSSGLPQHVAIIPDGNRRWAKEHSVTASEGHAAGAQVTEAIIKKARELGIRELSLWGSSLDNLTKRSMEEKMGLLQIYTDNFARLLESPEIHKYQVRIRCIGRWEEQFPEALKELLHKGMELTKHYDRHYLNFFLAYNGDDDMLNAMKTLSASKEEVTEKTLKQHLMTAEVAPVDLLIRTGGDPHLSNGFMMWETRNSALAFPDCFFPDFGPEAFAKVIADYTENGRRFGK